MRYNNTETIIKTKDMPHFSKKQKVAVTMSRNYAEDRGTPSGVFVGVTIFVAIVFAAFFTLASAVYRLWSSELGENIFVGSLIGTVIGTLIGVSIIGYEYKRSAYDEKSSHKKKQLVNQNIASCTANDSLHKTDQIRSC